MAVYVDPLMNCLQSAKWRHGVSCHMWADTAEELHEFAARIGMKRAWFQDHRRHDGTVFPHYDLTEKRRAVAVRMGAVEMDRRRAVAKWVELGYRRPRDSATASAP